MVSVRGSPKVGSPRPRARRPATRTLVRWDDDKDKKLLLTLQYVCNQRKLKIPWNLVAQAMGPSYSGGAIVQHLAKVRKLRVEEGLEVPPPLTKGGKLTPAEPKDDKKGSANKRARLREMVQDENNDEDSDDLEESSGSEDYYGRKKRKPKTQGKSRPRAVTEKERTSVSNAGRKIRGSNAASRATASDLFGPEDEDCQIKKHETSFEDSSAASQQNYAAGDSMWDLDSDDEGTEMEFKRSRSASPTEDAENPSKVLVLNIGVAGFQKLGLAGAKGKSPANRYNLQDGKGTYESLSYEDHGMGFDDGTDGVYEGSTNTPNVTNQSKTQAQKKGSHKTGGRFLLGEQQSDLFGSGPMGGVNQDIQGGRGSGSHTGHSQNEVDPFSYLAGHSYAENQAASGMETMHAGLGGSMGETAFPRQTTFSAGHFDWYNPTIAEQQQNTFDDGSHLFGRSLGNDGQDLGYGASLSEMQIDAGEPAAWSQNLYGDLDDILNGEDEPTF